MLLSSFFFLFFFGVLSALECPLFFKLLELGCGQITSFPLASSAVLYGLPVMMQVFPLFVAFRTLAWLILGTGEITYIVMCGACRCVGGDADMTVSLSRGGASVSRSGGGATVSRSGGGASVSRSGGGASVSRSGGGASVSRSGVASENDSGFGWVCRLQEVFEPHHKYVGLHTPCIVRYCDCASFISSSFILFLGKINDGGINDPAALMQMSTVTSCPLSADDCEPTCFFPRLAIILVNWVRWLFLSRLYCRPKNVLTAAWLPGCLAAWLPGCLAAWLPGCLAAWLIVLARAADVGSGVLKELLSLWRAIKS